MNLYKVYARALVLFAALLLPLSAQAGIVINGTRVIFPGNEREVTVKLTNAGNKPSLVQAWLDNGDPSAKPETISVPFTLSPPVFRMEPGKGQTLRMISTGEALPQNKESVFWLNILEIPPKPQGLAADENTLQFAFRTRVKVFYRPKNLQSDAGSVGDAPQQLSWKIVPNANGKGDAVEVSNPGPYYITISKLDLQAGGQSLAAKPGMVEPFGVLVIALEDGKAVPAGAVEVHFQTINDFGGDAPGTQTITR